MVRQRVPGFGCRHRKRAVAQCRAACWRNQYRWRTGRSETMSRGMAGNWTHAWCMREMHGYCTRMIIITVWCSCATAVLGVVILSVSLSVRLSHACFVTNPKNLPAIFLYHILITANMQLKTGFLSSHQLKSYVAPKSRLKLAARCPVSKCWPSCYNQLYSICYFTFMLAL